MTYYPVVIPTMSRYEHFKNCVESLSKNTHADKTELVIGLDYPASEKYEEGWKKIKDYIPTIKGFRKVTVFEHKENLGSVANWKFLQSYVSEHYDAWINTEDDNVFSPCFLDYMNKCLEKYKDDCSILAVSGYMDAVDFILANRQDANIVRMQDYMAYGLGKWRRTNQELDLYMPPHYMRYVCSHRKVLKKMKNNLRDLYQLIFWTKNNPALDIRCDFTIACYCIINGKYLINPTLSLVRNMGYDGSGEHCGALENDYYGIQKISLDSIFDIKDSLTEKQLKESIAEWERYKHNDFSAAQRKRVIRYYYAYMFLGYKGVELFLAIWRLLIKILRKIWNLVKGCIKR
ncbi:MAG: hypothetical protein IJR50_03025 [Treponema sp.]|nr:hypothetical protein [Treponema sp.]